MLLSFSVFGKDSTKVEFKKFALRIHGSPDYCYRTLSSLTNTNGYTYREKIELPMMGYTAGLDFSYFIKKQFGISLGVNFSQKGFRTGSIPAVDANGNSSGFAHIRYNYNYIDVPVKANLILGKKNIRFIACVGVTPAFLLYQRTITEIEHTDESKSTVKGKLNYIYNPFNFFLNGSVGIDYKLGEKMGIRIEPTYSYGLLETIGTPFSEHLWSAGLNASCYFRF